MKQGLAQALRSWNMATANRGLPAVPRGLSRELTSYLQSLQNVILNLSGLGRGTAQTRAVTVAEKVILQKEANTANSNGANGSDLVQTKNIANGAVTTNKLADGAVTQDKLAQEVWPVMMEGGTAHGETVNLGKWIERPLVFITGYEIPVGDCGEVKGGIGNLRLENGEWLFEAIAVCEFGIEDGEKCYPGKLDWIAIGRREPNEEA